MGKFKKIILVTLGSIALVLGVIGIFIPVLPTTPFLLLTAYLYSKSSKRLHKWLMSNRIFGKYLKNYYEGQGISLKTKIVSISTLWITILFSMYLTMENIIVPIILFIIATAVTIHLARKTTLKHKK